MGLFSQYSRELTFSPREKVILQLLASQQSHEEMMNSLQLQRKMTLLNYISNIRVKIAEQTGCVYDRDELAMWAKEHGYATNQ